jgi:hypothetical protein
VPSPETSASVLIAEDESDTSPKSDVESNRASATLVAKAMARPPTESTVTSSAVERRSCSSLLIALPTPRCTTFIDGMLTAFERGTSIGMAVGSRHPFGRDRAHPASKQAVIAIDRAQVPRVFAGDMASYRSGRLSTIPSELPAPPLRYVRPDAPVARRTARSKSSNPAR